MRNNIVVSIWEMLTSEIIGKFAIASGLDRSTAGDVVDAGVPAILSGLAELVAKPGGARKLMGAMAEQTSDPDRISSNLIGSARAAASGNDPLSAVLGQGVPNLVAAGIANLHGVSVNAARTVLGLLTPFVLGGLRRVQRARGLDANGLARMFEEQRDNIADAIPAGLSSYLRKSGLSDGDSLRRPSARPMALHVASLTAAKSADAPKGMTLPYWALALVALGGLLWMFVPNPEGGPNQTASVSDLHLERSMFLPPTIGVTGYIARPHDNWTSIGASPNDYVNHDIYNARGEALGTVRDLLIAPDGKAAAAVIGVGHYLGMGDKVVAVPFTALRVEQRKTDRRIVVDLAKEALQSAPEYENSPIFKQ